jgi:hypothetical protein
MFLYATQYSGLFLKIKFVHLPVIVLTSVFPIISDTTYGHIWFNQYKYKDKEGRKEHLYVTHTHMEWEAFFNYRNLYYVYKSLKFSFWITDLLEGT